MKNILGALWILFLVLAGIFVATRGHSTDFLPAFHDNTYFGTILTASGTTTTNSTGSALKVEQWHYHTIQGTNGSSTLQQFAVDRSLDGTAWIVVGTNALTANGTAETTMIGHWTYIRARQIGTNAAMGVLYLGGN